MNLDDIRSSVDAGDTIYWRTRHYKVVRSPDRQTYLVCHDNGQCFNFIAPDGEGMFTSAVDFARA